MKRTIIYNCNNECQCEVHFSSSPRITSDLMVSIPKCAIRTWIFVTYESVMYVIHSRRLINVYERIYQWRITQCVYICNYIAKIVGVVLIFVIYCRYSPRLLRLSVSVGWLCIFVHHTSLRFYCFHVALLFHFIFVSSFFIIDLLPLFHIDFWPEPLYLKIPSIFVYAYC